jgi:hypothetical protein
MTELVRYDTMCRAIAEALEVDEVKTIRDKALAWEVYSTQAKNKEAEAMAIQIRLRAERRAGELLLEMEKAKGQLRQGSNSPRSSPSTTGKTLADLGVSKDQSSKWQKLAKLPAEEFERQLAEGKRSATAMLVDDADVPPTGEITREAYALYGHLTHIADVYAGGNIEELTQSMTPRMYDHLLQVVPQIIAWLSELGGGYNDLGSESDQDTRTRRH